MRIEDFDFELPDAAIARFPPVERDGARMMLLERAGGTRVHRAFLDLPSLLDPGDLLVLNDSRVIPARLRAKKAESGGKVEVLLVEPVTAARAGTAGTAGTEMRVERWRAMVAASKRVRPGARLALEADEAIALTVVADEGEGFVVLELEPGARAVDLARRFGELPLPPYLGRAAEASDQERYQTVFARAGAEGSVAAPTAGLHFTPRVFAALAARGIEHATITLHVGPGTFLPVRSAEIEAHRMLPERFVVPEATAAAIARARASGRRVVAVGTTVTRVLESLGPLTPATAGATDLFIRPGHRFVAVDALLTNFHLPRSTLVMLVAAFAGREAILDAYREAVAAGYRFFSYGDAMLIRGPARSV